jgi:hypothetical protein
MTTVNLICSKCGKFHGKKDVDTGMINFRFGRWDSFANEVELKEIFYRTILNIIKISAVNIPEIKTVEDMERTLVSFKYINRFIEQLKVDEIIVAMKGLIYEKAETLLLTAITLINKEINDQISKNILDENFQILFSKLNNSFIFIIMDEKKNQIMPDHLRSSNFVPINMQIIGNLKMPCINKDCRRRNPEHWNEF